MKNNHPWYFYYLKAAISKIWRWSPYRRKVLEKAEVKGGKQCSKCREIIKPTKKNGRNYSGVEVDHIIPVVDPSTGLIDWHTYITKKLDATEQDLQVLCVNCHDVKSAKENALRRERGN